MLRKILVVFLFVSTSVSVFAQDVDPASVGGSISSAGSSTVGPVTERMMALFAGDGFGGTLNNDVIGTGGGFERFCIDAVTDVSNASRPIREGEIEACRAQGREPIGFNVGIDALAVTVSAENDFVDNMTIDDLAAVFSGRATTWSDLDPSWPNEPIYPYSPGTDSGTYDYFVEEVFDGDESLILSVPGIQFSESDTVLVTYIEQNRNAIGYFGYAYFYPERARLNAVTIEGIEPNEVTAESGEYPLSRPLFIYSSPSILQSNPQVAAFVRYYLNNVNEQLGTQPGQIGYFPVSEGLMQSNFEALDAALNE